MQKTTGPKYASLREISRRARSWLDKPLRLDGVWAESDAFHVLLKGKAGNSNLEGTLSLTQAKALRTMLEVEIFKLETMKK